MVCVCVAVVVAAVFVLLVSVGGICGMCGLFCGKHTHTMYEWDVNCIRWSRRGRGREREREEMGSGVSRRLSLAAASETSKQTNAETTNS